MDEYQLPPALGKASDARAAGFVARHGLLVQVEFETLDPTNLHALLAREVDALVDAELVAVEEERQRGERVRLRTPST